MLRRTALMIAALPMLSMACSETGIGAARLLTQEARAEEAGPGPARPAETRPPVTRSATANVTTFAAVPGIEPSTRFSARVFDGKEWRKAFVCETVGPKREKSGIYSRGVYEAVTGYSASWCSFEMNAPVKVEIAKLSEGDIETCVIRPLSRKLKAAISQDKRKVTFEIKPRMVGDRQVPVNVAVEINGNLKEMMTVFASPPIEGKPDPEGAGVLKVTPGEMPPTDGEWHTMYFLPGVHDLGKKAFPIRANRKYFINGDVWIDGGFSSKKKYAPNARIYGLGVISGRKIGWREVDTGKACKPMHLFGEGAQLEGVVIVNSPHHSLMGLSRNPDKPVIMRNVKTHNWRTNTDGIHIFGHGIVEDCFIHGQDDCHYCGSASQRAIFRRMVYWHDGTFGVDIIFTAGGGGKHNLTEDCDSIYYNAHGPNIQLRKIKSGQAIEDTIIRDIRIEDPNPKRPIISLTPVNPQTTFRKTHFKNIVSLVDNHEPIVVYGAGADAVVEDVTFEDIRLGDRYLHDFSPKNFELAFVKGLKIVRDGKVVATYSSDIAEEAKHLRPDPANLLLNPGFELGRYGWRGGAKVGSDVVSPHEGKWSLKWVKGLRQTVRGDNAGQRVGAGRHRASAWMWTEDENVAGTLSFWIIQINRGTGKRLSRGLKGVTAPLVPGKWTRVVGEIDIPWDQTKYDWFRLCWFNIGVAGKPDAVYVDDARVEKVR